VGVQPCCCSLTLTHTVVNDVCVHPNQGELISCDQAGSIKQWDLSDNICTHELVGAF
jgi:G protein beta subunit-like protein